MLYLQYTNTNIMKTTSKNQFKQGFTKQNLNSLRDIVNQKLTEACKEMGIPVASIGNISFNSNECSTKVIFKNVEVSRLSPKEFSIGDSFKIDNKRSIYKITAIKDDHFDVKTDRGALYGVPFTLLDKITKVNEYGFPY